MAIKIGYPDMEYEKEIITSRSTAMVIKDLAPALSGAEVSEIQELAGKVRVEEGLVNYILAIAAGTRAHKAIRLGVSPRGTITLYKSAQARAMVQGRDYCIPDDIKGLAQNVFAHRIIPASKGVEDIEDSQAIISEILSEVAVPV